MPVHLWKAFSDTVKTLSGILKSMILVLCGTLISSVMSLLYSTPSIEVKYGLSGDTTISDNWAHPLKVSVSILFTLDGMYTSEIVALSIILYLNLLTPSGRKLGVIEPHSAKA